MKRFTDLIGIAELKDLMVSSDVSIVDCRFNLMDPGQGRREFLDGHIHGAVYAHLDDDLASPITPSSGRHPLPEIDKFVATLGDWGISNDSQVVVYDHANGAVAARLWWMLRWLGHENVAVLDGGIAGWKGAGEALESELVAHPRTTFVAAPDSDMIATTREISAAVSAGEEINLIDARDAARYRGDVEPIDAVAGHVPGALNMPFPGGVDDNGTWLDAAHHRSAWDGLLAGRPEKPLIVMCGSGVTACHLVISARLAGRPAPRLYVGSWSEWIRDESRPIGSSGQSVE